MIFAIILIAHWVGDYLFQSTRMAVEKSSSFKWLTTHVATYTGVILAFSIFLFPWKTAILYVGINGLLHFITDFFTSKLAAKHQDNARIFYPILGFDQLVHGLCLYLTYINLELLL